MKNGDQLSTLPYVGMGFGTPSVFSEQGIEDQLPIQPQTFMGRVIEVLLPASLGCFSKGRVEGQLPLNLTSTVDMVYVCGFPVGVWIEQVGYCYFLSYPFSDHLGREDRFSLEGFYVSSSGLMASAMPYPGNMGGNEKTQETPCHVVL